VPRRKKKKGERYIDRWLREHPRISLYLNKEEYTRLVKIADSKNIGIKELILSMVDDVSKYYDSIYKKGHEEGYNAALEKFKVNPRGFYAEIKYRYKIEPALFTVPCSYCSKPVIYSHADPNWNIKKETLYEAFEGIYHICCREVVEGKKESCEHIT